MNIQTETTLSGTAKVVRVYRLGTRRLTRAHLALQRRPETVGALGQVATSAAVALAQQLGCPVTVKAHLVDATFQLERALGRSQALALVALDAPASVGVLEVDRPVLLAALARMSGGSALPTPSAGLNRIEEAAFGFLALVALDAGRAHEATERLFTPRLLGANVTREEALDAVDGRAAHLAVRLDLDVAGVKGQARLFLHARAVQAQVQAEPLAEPGELLPEVSAASIEVRTFAGQATLDAPALASLEPGDVVLFDGLSCSQGHLQGAGRLSSSGFAVLGAFGADGFHISRAFARGFPQESSMSIPASKNDSASLPVEVEIELTRLRLTVAELAQVRPGAILPLHINASEPVLLKVGDRAVARAELVEIEGEVGARILSLLS
jgi:type III secretion protein Q